jgi:2-methylisocitrate lyase-like PEP mutase family enzyme
MLPRIPPNRLIDVAEMQGKIAAAVEARRSSDTLIIARSDVVATMDRASYRTEGRVAEVIDRSNAYLAAGADVIFVMAFDEEDLRLYRREIAGPLVGVFAPAEPLPIKAFRDAGFEMTIGSLVSLYASIRGVAAALARLRDTEDWNTLSDLVVTDAEFYELVGLEAVAAQFRKYGVR